jgi:methyl-accepting chemotaxis protein
MIKIFDFFKNSSLTSRFVLWFLGISLIPFFIVGLFGYNTTKGSLEQANTEKLLMAREAVTKNIVSYFSEEKIKIEFIIRSGVLNPATKDIETIQGSLGAISITGSGAVTEFVLNTRGKVIASTDQNMIGSDKSKDLCFIDARGQTYVKDFYKSDTGSDVFSISTPILADDGTGFYGVFVVEYGLAPLEKMLDGYNKNIGKTANVYLVNSDRNFINTKYAPEGSMIKKTEPMSAVDSCLNGKTTLGQFKNFDKKDILGSYNSLDMISAISLKWCVAAEADLTEINTKTNELGRNLSLWGFVFMVIILALAFYAALSIGNFVRTPILKIAKQLISASGVLAASTQESSAVSQQNAATAEQLAAGSIQQSKQLEEISQDVSTMDVASKQIDSSTQSASTISLQAAEVVQKAGESGESSQQSLLQIKNQVNDIVAVVRGIVKSSEQIEEIVNTITNIANQTNLLALNAAIEAARAGEAGRGFAVVADEVRKLADNSSNAAKDIKEKIKNVIVQVEDAVHTVETGVTTVEVSTGSISATLGSLQDVLTFTQQVSAKISEIKNSTVQQSDAIHRISEHVKGISGVAERNAAGSQQLSESVLQQSATNEKIAASTQQLVALAGDLEKVSGTADLPEVVKNSVVFKIKK